MMYLKVTSVVLRRGCLVESTWIPWERSIMKNSQNCGSWHYFSNEEVVVFHLDRGGWN